MKNILNIWKTIILGTYSANEYRKIRDLSNGVLERALDNPKFTIASEKKEVKLVNVSVNELGFPNGAEWKDIWAKAKQLNLELCPPEVGLHLLLQYKNQLKKGSLYIAMEPIYDYASYLGHSNNGWIIFAIHNGGNPFFDFYPCWNSFRGENYRYIFVSKG